ncbi:LysR family transcriptional regulator [Chenggangzhangella methanolivorans]|uniref:LysR family transcriptional regulator n=1 Tax=Chenggangzhangella methanolivorans TaxID=1437009 RepID=A0A9E6RCF8_9HYPH|nr:LysR family transcriptional regulator [Chenggangzhangella methanolivorans]QZO01780.1 LysR family transcriptional regulator [Chenggangzhangella methanolivorans]
MDRLDAMAMFVSTVDEGSLAAAARKLALSPAKVTRALQMLEERLGERLIHRNARRLRLTEAGERRLPVYRSVLAELEAADAGAGETVDGRIGVTAPELFGRLHVMPVIESFLAAHPAARARALLLNRMVDLVEEGLDVAVRLAPLPDSGIVATRLGEVRKLVCASPDYVAQAGAPATPHDLTCHACIGEQEGDAGALWRFVDPAARRAKRFSVPITPRLALNSAGAAIDAAVRGRGVCSALSYQVAGHVAAGRLMTLLDAFEPEPTPVSLVFHPVPRRNVTLRAFIDHATPRLREDLANVSRRIGGRPAEADVGLAPG